MLRMSSAADKIKANAERLRAKTPAKSVANTVTAPTADEQHHDGAAATPAEAAPTETAPSVPVRTQGAIIRQKSVRRTVDLSPSAHRGLDNWQRDTADRLGLARVTGQDVLAALVERLLADDELAEHVVRIIAAQRT